MLEGGLRLGHSQSGRLEFLYIGMALRALALKHDTELQSFWTTCTIDVGALTNQWQANIPHILGFHNTV